MQRMITQHRQDLQIILYPLKPVQDRRLDVYTMIWKATVKKSSTEVRLKFINMFKQRRNKVEDIRSSNLDWCEDHKGFSEADLIW